MITFSILQIVGGFLLALGYWPQLVKLVKTKNASSFSVPFLSLLWLGVALMVPYSIELLICYDSWAFLVSNSLSLAMATVLLTLVLYYQRTTE